MALRTAARRWPAASPQVQAAAALRQQSRAFADEYTGRAMGDKERAAEAQWIKKMEEEILQKKKALNAQSGTASTSTAPKAGEAPTPTTEGGFRNTAVVAGLIAAVAGYWLLSGSSKKEDKEEKESS